MKKYRYSPSLVIHILLTFLLALNLFMCNPLIARAEDVKVDVKSTDFKGGSSTYKGGVTYARTGYLCYLVGADGSLIDGMTAKAFKCGGYQALGGEQWRCKAKKGSYGTELTHFEGTAPWSYSCFNEDKTSNAENIKRWMKELDSNNQERGITFVYGNWGKTIGDKFSDGDYILVLENILSFQPSIKRDISATDIYNGTYPLHVDFVIKLGTDQKEYSFGKYVHIKSGINSAQVKRMYEDYNMRHPNNRLSIKDAQINATVASLNRMFNDLASKEVNKIINDSSEGIKEAKGSPVVGTLAQCINYEKEVGGNPAIFAGYTNKVACFSEYIGTGGAGEKAGYKPWTGSTSNKISDSDVAAYGVGMMVIAVKDGGGGDDQTTCDEPEQPKPHPAPNESTGTTTIIKNYRTMDKTGKMMSDDGCFKTDNVSNRIDIEDEDTYKVVGFKISTTVQDNIPSETWETVVPAVTRQGDKPETVELTTPEVCLYVLLEKSDDNINTWDRPLNDIPGPAPDHPSKSTLPQLSIVKNYRTKDSTTGTIISDDGCFIRKDVVPGITIDDEPEYKVVGWKVSTTTQDNIDSIAWNPPGTISQTGTTKGSTSLDETKNEVCLYVLLEKESLPTQPSNYNYILPQSRITRRIWLSAPENPLSEQIQTHEFVWHIDEHSPSSCSGHYCTLHSCSGHTVHHGHDSSCSPNCTRSHTSTDYCSNGCKDKNHTEYCTGWKYMDRGLNLSLYNIKKLNYEDIVATKQEWVNGTGEVDHTKGFIKSYVKDGAFNRGNNETDASAQDYRETNWDYICVLHRGQDALTLLEYKNQSLPGASAANTELRDVNSKGYKVANTDSGTRQLTVYYDKFSVELVNDTTTPGYDIRTVFGPTASAPHTGASCGTNTREVVLTTPLALNDIGVKVEVYSGSQAGGKDNVTSGLPSRTAASIDYKGTNNNKTRGVMIPSGGSVSFRPYIQMQYDTITNIDKKAYVIGEYQRQLTPNDYAEVSYDSSRGGALKLSSLQWSTHKSSNGKKVLPGGAALSLSIPDSEQRYVRATTYQCILDSNSAGAEQINRIGGTSSLQDSASALVEHKNFVDSVVKGLDNINIQQWVNKDGGNPFNGIKVDNVNNTNIRALGNGAKDGKVSMDSKYYFTPDGTNSPAGEGDLDVEIITEDAPLIYTFFTNTKGEVRVVLNDANAPLTNENAGTPLHTINVNDTEWDKGDKFTGGTDLLSDAKCINKRTQIVDKLIQAVEAGTGYDVGIPGKVNAPSWRSPYWYNEAFDGISVAVNSSVIKVGFKNPAERQIILDPKLIPLQTSQSNMNTDSTYSSGFKTKDYTPVYQSQPRQVGEFRGARIDLADMDTFFSTRSDYFNIPNQTVQDLH